MANLKSEQLSYTVGDTELNSYFVCDGDSSEARPGVLVIHEWWGLNDYIRRRADMLAELGYAALAVDMYGDGLVAESADEAGAAMNAVLTDMTQGEARLQASLEQLKSQPMTDPQRTAAIGYCFGGRMVLHMACSGMDVSGVVSFHGSLGSFGRPAANSVKARVLVCHGANDSLISQDDIDVFKSEMEQAKANYEFVNYDGALHGFTNPDADAKAREYGLPLAYDQTTDDQSWAKMQQMFADIF